MKFFRVITGLIMLVTIFLFNSPVVNANYQFDDVYGSSGSGAQWIVITGSRQTKGGDADSVSMDVKGDIVSDRNSLTIESGETNEEVSNTDIYNILLVLPETTTDLTINYASTFDGEPTTPDLVFSDGNYITLKNSSGSPVGTGYDDNWKQYVFTINKTNSNSKYDSVKQYLGFGQNPSDKPSQALNIPFVIANVYNYTATDKTAPLVFRTILRDQASRGNIVAYNKFNWGVTADTTQGENQWVFLALDSESDMYDSNPEYYFLTAEITNNCGIRYAVQRYDTYTTANPQPSYWKFDLPRNLYTDDLYPQFYLNELSHIAPGLTSVYTGLRFNIKAGNKRVIPLYRPDPNDPNPYNLILNHKIIFGKNLGEATGELTGNVKAYPYKITGFRLLGTNDNFLPNVQRNLKSSYTPSMPDVATISNGSVEVTTVGDANSVLHSVRLRQQITGNYRHSKSVDGILPVHITFNIPKDNLLLSKYWDALVDEWYSKGNIDNLFSKYFSINLLSFATDSSYINQHLDLTDTLDKLGYYKDQVKVFVDEDRGVLTVSFILLLLDGISDGVKPSVTVVPDEIDDVSNEYIVVRDGYEDDKWDLGIYIARVGYESNIYSGSSDVSPSATASGSGGGGGGCNSGFWALSFVLILIFALSYKKLRYEI